MQGGGKELEMKTIEDLNKPENSLYNNIMMIKREKRNNNNNNKRVVAFSLS
jgi:hypothetical protein